MKCSPEGDYGGWAKPQILQLPEGKKKIISSLQSSLRQHGDTWKCRVLKTSPGLKDLCERLFQPPYPPYSRTPLWKAACSHQPIPGFLVLFYHRFPTDLYLDGFCSPGGLCLQLLAVVGFLFLSPHALARFQVYEERLSALGKGSARCHNTSVLLFCTALIRF